MKWISQFLQRYPKAPHFIALARLDKPIGIYLLLWPTLGGLWIASDGFPGWHLLIVFVAGTILTRSAGCVINDIADREFDKDVSRTNQRPLTQGLVSVQEAIVFMVVLLFLAFLLVITTNWLTLVLAVAAAAIAGLYPFMKRYTYLPQVVLGIAFSFGIPMGFAATQGDIPTIAWLLVAANVLWTVAYDTQYAMVDREEDLKIGVKSTAILFADMDKAMIGALQAMFIFTLLLLHKHMELGWAFNLSIVGAIGLLAYQQYLIKDRSREGCFTAFRHNHWVGLTIFLGFLLEVGF